VAKDLFKAFQLKKRGHPESRRGGISVETSVRAQDMQMGVKSK